MGDHRGHGGWDHRGHGGCGDHRRHECRGEHGRGSGVWHARHSHHHHCSVILHLFPQHTPLVSAGCRGW